MPDEKAINEYLFHEFGYDLQQDPSAIADDWPFELHIVGAIHSAKGEIKVFEFTSDDEAYFALLGSTLTFCPAAGMTLYDLQLQHDGAAWIARQDPIDLATSRLGDDLVPSASERRTMIEELVTNMQISPRILEGLYLRRTRTYLALINDTRSETQIVVGTGLEPQAVAFPQASSWRRLALGVGKMLREGILT